MKTPPLSERMRPKAFDAIVGQESLLGSDGFIARLVKANKPLSIILWGPPGSGKTSIARLYAQAFSLKFVAMSAIFSGVADLRKIVQEAQQAPLFAKGTLVFVDEIHRFNKAQQEAFLPFLEDGTLLLVGATAENPSFHLSSALLSRTRVLEVKPLSLGALEKLLHRYETTHQPLPLTPEAREQLLYLAQSDGRYLFNLIEAIEDTEREHLLLPEDLAALVQQRAPLYDRGGDQHYQLISALHKAIRGSDPDASLYWFARMLEGGEEPLFLARRLIRIASEDVGLADPQALQIALAGKEAYQMLGSPEGELALAQVVVYLALAPKSNALYTAYGQARRAAHSTTNQSPPQAIINAPTRLMKQQGYGKGYQYDHDLPEAFSGQNYFPDGMERPTFYKPVARGFERELQKRLAYFERLRNSFPHP